MGNFNSTFILFFDSTLDENEINKDKYKQEEDFLFVFYENDYYYIKNIKTEKNNNIKLKKESFLAYMRQLYINGHYVFSKDFKICLYNNDKIIVTSLIRFYNNLEFNNKKIKLFNITISDYLLILEDLTKSNCIK